jgi:hypothetical protein
MAGFGRSTRKTLKPIVLFGAFSRGVVLVMSTIPFALSTPEIRVFRPFTTNSSPSSTAAV